MAGLFTLESSLRPSGDQPDAIARLVRGLSEGRRYQTLEGVTGSGKTFTIANVIAARDQPALIISHNKTLAAQLYSELKALFPSNAVEYFISYYDYYQPEAYIPQTDTHIEKDASINEEIEKLRLSATNSLMSRDDVIIVASVSCIYGLGSPDDYRDMVVVLQKGHELDRDEMLKKLVDIHYTRNDYEPEPGTFRVRGDTVDIFPSYSDDGLRVDFFGPEVESIRKLEPVSGHVEGDMVSAVVSPAKHFVMPKEKVEGAISLIVNEMKERVKFFEKENKLLEAQRIQMRTMFDVEMLQEMGYCSGIENYSRHLSGRGEGEPPSTLINYYTRPFLTIIDESHVTIPQLRAMYNGDQSRKQTLVDFGFRLPSAKDNRPLSFDEFLDSVGQTVFMTATPGPFEKEHGGEPVRQVVRPTGLVDPEVIVRPLAGQIDDLIEEVRAHAERGERVLVTTLTKRTAEDLADYLHDAGLRARYLHSDIDALDRVEILRKLRKSDFDCLIGINLLREGLDLPEVALVAVLDADKEGFLRSETALIQTAGRAARNINGKVILYADNNTDAIRSLLQVTRERRARQLKYNDVHGVVPTTIVKEIGDSLRPDEEARSLDEMVVRETGVEYDIQSVIHDMTREMLEAAESLEFERAAVLRDEIKDLEERVSKQDDANN